MRAYSVSDFEKCTTLFRYFSLLCYLELRSIALNLKSTRHYVGIDLGPLFQVQHKRTAELQNLRGISCILLIILLYCAKY